jgi:serine/threonine-protein kinase
VADHQLGTELKRSKYRILGLVGQGQFGRVFCAVHRQTGRLVALKNLEQQRFSTHKFLRELRFLLSLQHPNIVTCRALEHTRTGRYLVMDYCEGGTLRTLMERKNLLTLSQSLRLITNILVGLDHAHNRNIVHCDIKPENILLSLQPDGWIARISDFGIARLSQELGQDPGNTGSPAYMAPERFYGQYSHSSDLYSVGILLFELITGYRPFSGTPLELMSAHLCHPPQLPNTIPEALRPVLLSSLQKLPARRLRSATEMLTMLRTAIATEGATAWLQQPTAHFSVPQAAIEPEICLAEPHHQQPLQHAVACIAIADQTKTLSWKPGTTHPGRGLYRASAAQVVFQFSEPGTWTGESGRLLQTRKYSVEMPSPVRELMLCPQGCFAITQRSIHLIYSDRHSSNRFTTQLIAELEQDYVAAIEAQGLWLATAIEAKPSRLLLWQLKKAKNPVWVPPQPINLPMRNQTSKLIQLIALDSRHLMIASHVLTRRVAPLNMKDKPDSAATISTLLEIYTRRGDRLGALSLPLNLRQIITTPIPYRLLATDQYHPQTVWIIDLKPYRVLQMQLEITPKHLIASSWGYIFIDIQGHIVLLDEYGHQVGRIDGPANPTAIASFNHHKLLIATWNGSEGSLHSLDLRQLEVDLMF